MENMIYYKILLTDKKHKNKENEYTYNKNSKNIKAYRRIITTTIDVIEKTKMRTLIPCYR